MIFKCRDIFFEVVCADLLVLYDAGNLQLFDTISNSNQLGSPHRRPSISIERTSFSTSCMSVSSSQGLTSSIRLDLATGGAFFLELLPQQHSFFPGWLSE